MAQYCVHRTAQPTGEHEVHILDTLWPTLPSPENQLPLGVHSTCHTAILKAKQYFNSVDGSKHCSPACHRRQSGENRAMTPPRLSQQHLDFLQTLVTGASLQGASKALGVSDRNGRRIAAEVRAALGVRSNYQAIAKASGLGLLDLSCL